MFDDTLSVWLLKGLVYLFFEYNILLLIILLLLIIVILLCQDLAIIS